VISLAALKKEIDKGTEENYFLSVAGVELVSSDSPVIAQTKSPTL